MSSTWYGLKRREQAQTSALDVEATIAIQQALVAFARDDRTKAKVAQILLADGLGRETMGIRCRTKHALQKYNVELGSETVFKAGRSRHTLSAILSSKTRVSISPERCGCRGAAAQGRDDCLFRRSVRVESNRVRTLLTRLTSVDRPTYTRLNQSQPFGHRDRGLHPLCPRLTTSTWQCC